MRVPRLTRALAGPLFVAKDPAIKRSVILTETIGTLAGRDYYRTFVRFDDQDSIVAVMDTDLHSHTNHVYDAMWRDQQVRHCVLKWHHDSITELHCDLFHMFAN